MFLRLRKQEGFTLIELLIVVTILGILAAIAIPKFSQNIANSNTAGCQSNQSSINKALEMYAFNNDGSYPGAVAGLVTDFLKTEPKCPTDKTAYGITSGVAKCTGTAKATHNL